MQPPNNQQLQHTMKIIYSIDQLPDKRLDGVFRNRLMDKGSMELKDLQEIVLGVFKDHVD